MNDEKPLIWYYRERRKAQSLYELSRCNEKVPAWKFVQPTRCNLARGHAGECDHR